MKQISIQKNKGLASACSTFLIENDLVEFRLVKGFEVPRLTQAGQILFQILRDLN